MKNRFKVNIQVTHEEQEFLKDNPDKEKIIKGNIFQYVAKDVVELLYPELKDQPMTGGTLYTVECFIHTHAEMIEFLEDLKKYPNKVDDMLKMLTKKVNKNDKSTKLKAE